MQIRQIIRLVNIVAWFKAPDCKLDQAANRESPPNLYNTKFGTVVSPLPYFRTISTGCPPACLLAATKSCDAKTFERLHQVIPFFVFGHKTKIELKYVYGSDRATKFWGKKVRTISQQNFFCCTSKVLVLSFSLQCRHPCAPIYLVWKIRGNGI